jgi:hypothetical protein
VLKQRRGDDAAERGLEREELGSGTLAAQLQHRHAAQELEALSAGATRVEEEPAPLHTRIAVVTMAAHHQVWLFASEEPGRVRPESVRLAEIVEDQDLPPFEAYGPPLRKLAGQRGTIVVAADRPHRGQLPQRGEDMLPADVASVKDQLDAAEHLRDGRVEQTVRVGNDPYAHDAIFRTGGASG